MDWRIIYKAVTKSTNNDALGGESGDVFVAGMQTAGRGRLDHKWLSPPNENLMMSAVVGVAGVPPHEAATLPLVAGLTVAQTVDELVPRCRKDASADVVEVKWPNDVLINGRKVCGILCERNGDNVIIGIGVNVNQTLFHPDIAARAISLATVIGAKMPVEKVRDTLLRHLSGNIEFWRKEGFLGIFPELSKYDCLKGRHITVRRTDDDANPVSGICGGIRPDGMLDVSGEAISAGEAHIMA